MFIFSWFFSYFRYNSLGLVKIFWKFSNTKTGKEDDCCGREFLVDSCYIEVKGVTLIVDGEARFPDAPTERGAKHLKELIKLKNDGNRAVVFFLIQHPAGNDFRPNWENDPKFSQTLVEAENAGVEILVYKCNNTLEGIELVPKSLDYDLNALKNK